MSVLFYTRFKVNNNLFLLKTFSFRKEFYKCLSINTTNEIPVIKIPKYLETNLGNSISKEHRRLQKNNEKKKKKVDSHLMNKLLISSSNSKKMNHYYGQQYNPNNLTLISKNWLRRFSIGERMTFHNIKENPSLMNTDLNDEKKSFESLGLSANIVNSINKLINSNSQVITPSVVQYGVIPLILAHKNVIFSAETGSGKTVAYLAPIIQMIAEQKRLFCSNDFVRCPRGLVILPSRELTEQVGHVASILASSTDVGVSTMIGGIPKHIKNTGFDLIVTTIGMVENHINKGVYSLKKLNHIVLDETDTLLDDTFSYEVMGILEQLNLKSNTIDPDDGLSKNETSLNGTQLICSSATLPKTLDSTIGALIDFENDVEQVSTENLHCLHSNVKHVFYRLDKLEKDVKLIELLKEDIKKKKSTIIFANRANAVNWLFHFLNENDMHCIKLTAEMTEEERYQSFNLFQNGHYDILVSTDLGSRGLDTTNVRHVINFDSPHYVSDYIHRAGRTGRLGSNGSCMVSTFVAYKQDAYMLMELEKAVRLAEPLSDVNANIRAQISQRRAEKREKLSRNF